MKRTIKIVIILIVVAAVGSGVYWMYKLAQYRKQAVTTRVEKVPLKVTVVMVQVATLEKKTAITGEIEPLHAVDVVPKVTGRLEHLHLPDGTLIEEGAIIKADSETKTLPVIAVIEHESLEAALEQVKASLEVANAALERTKVTVTDCTREKKRFERLFKEGATTQQQLDKAITAYDGSFTEQKLAKAQVAQAEAAVRQAQVRLDDATIESPIFGVVISKYIDPGNMVGPTTPLIRIAQTDTVKVVGGVSERHLRSITPGKTNAIVTVDAFPNETFKGKVYMIGQSIDSATRTIKVEIRIPNPDHRLKVGMFARVELTLERKTDATVIPDSAILRDEQGPYIYIINNSKAYRHSVTLGLAEGVLHEVKEGLKPGDKIVIRGQRQLQDGEAVETVEENQP